MISRQQVNEIPSHPKFSIGADLTEIKRFRGLSKGSQFVTRVFSEREIDYCYRYSDPAPHLAVTFAGKEAVVKALNAETPLGMQMIEVLRDEIGAPQIHLPDSSKLKISLSLSHTSEYAAAVVLIFDENDLDVSMSTQKLLNEVVREILPDE